MPRLIETFAPGSEEWLEQRRTRLGGSEIAAVLGVSPHESLLSLWLRKAGMIGPKPDLPEMEWGRRLESAVLRKWLDNHRDTHGLFGTGETFVHDEHDWMLASPDARVAPINSGMDSADCEVVEIKTAMFADEWGQPGTDEIPPYYLLQVRHYLATLGLTVAHVAVLIGGIDYREYRVEQDPADLDLILTRGPAFLASVTAGQKPPIDGSDATYQAVRQLHPDIDPDSIDLPADIGDAYIAAITAHKAAEESKRQQMSRVLDLMGRAQQAWHDGRKVATRQARGDGLPYLVSARNLGKPTTTGEAA